MGCSLFHRPIVKSIGLQAYFAVVLSAQRQSHTKILSTYLLNVWVPPLEGHAGPKLSSWFLVPHRASCVPFVSDEK